MSQNPYAHPMDLPPEPEYGQRTSALAIASLVFGLLCCIPGVGLIGTILGGAALVRISGSRGRLGGRGLALVGIVLGILGTVVYIAVILGLMSFLNGLTVYGDTFANLQSKNYASVRAMLDPATSAAVTDERLDEFAADLQTEHGTYRGVPKGLGEWFGGYGQLGQQIQPILDRVPAGRNRTIPLPLKFDQGYALGMFIINPGAGTGPTGAALIEDMAFVDRSGQPVWLMGTLAGQPPPPAPTTPPTTPPASPPSEAPTGPETPPAPTGG